MARVHEAVNGVLGFKNHADGKRDTHVAAHPVFSLETALTVLDYIVSKHDQWERALCVNLCDFVGCDVDAKN